MADNPTGTDSPYPASRRSGLRNLSNDRRRLAVLRRSNQSRRRLTMIFIGTALLVVAGILTAGFVIAFVLPPRQTVVRVNDVQYSRADLVSALRAQQAQSRLFGAEFQASQQIFDALRLFVEDEILFQVSSKYGITVSDVEIDRHVETDLLIYNPGIDPLTVHENFGELYGRHLNKLKLPRSDHRDLTRRSILRAKFREFVGEQIPRVAEQAHYHRIVMAVGSEVDIMRVKLKDGLSQASTPEQRSAVWKHIVREFSMDDAEIVRIGGDMGWIPVGSSDTYADSILRLGLGEISEPITDVENPKLILFFMISERELARELSPSDLEEFKSRALQDWVNKERDNHDVDAAFDSDIYSWMLEQLQQTAVPTPTPLGPSMPGL